MADVHTQGNNRYSSSCEETRPCSLGRLFIHPAVTETKGYEIQALQPRHGQQVHILSSTGTCQLTRCCRAWQLVAGSALPPSNLRLRCG